MNIITISKSVKIPVELAPAPTPRTNLPNGVLERAKRGKPWHLLAWRDDISHQSGFCHKGKFIIIELENVERIALNFMTPAKSAGWVALEVVYKESRADLTILESKVFNPQVLAWFKENLKSIEAATGFTISTNDYGADY